MLLIDSVVDKNTNAAESYFAPDMRPKVKQSIIKFINENTVEVFLLRVSNYEVIDENKVKFNFKVESEGPSWSVYGVTTYFVIEKSNDKYYIYDTNFYEKIGMSGALKILLPIFGVLLVYMIFLVWMLIDCAKREMESKTKWILIILFVPLLGPIIYLFLIKLKKK